MQFWFNAKRHTKRKRAEEREKTSTNECQNIIIEWTIHGRSRNANTIIRLVDFFDIFFFFSVWFKWRKIHMNLFSPSFFLNKVRSFTRSLTCVHVKCRSAHSPCSDLIMHNWMNSWNSFYSVMFFCVFFFSVLLVSFNFSLFRAKSDQHYFCDSAK